MPEVPVRIRIGLHSGNSVPTPGPPCPPGTPAPLPNAGRAPLSLIRGKLVEGVGGGYWVYRFEWWEITFLWGRAFLSPIPHGLPTTHTWSCSTFHVNKCKGNSISSEQLPTLLSTHFTQLKEDHSCYPVAATSALSSAKSWDSESCCRSEQHILHF